MTRTIAVWLLTAGMALAGWAPEWTNGTRFAMRVMADQALTAAIERAHSVGVSTNGKSFWWGSFFRQRSKLATAKALLKSCRGDSVGTVFTDMAKLDGEGTLKTFLATSSPPVYYATDAALLTRAGAPTNWLDQTPWFNLNTHSNGFAYFRAVCSNLVLTFTLASEAQQLVPAFLGSGSTNTPGDFDDAVTFLGANYRDATNAAQESQVAFVGQVTYLGQTDVGGGNTSYLAQAWSRKGYAMLDNPWTNTYPEPCSYFWTTNYDSDQGLVAWTNQSMSAYLQGVNMQTGTWSGVTQAWYYIGHTNIGWSFPTQVIDSQTNEAAQNGWYWDDGRSIYWTLDYRKTNGFTLP